jgi:protein-disulfide isomerase/uncharacterized membrane protein
MNPRGLSPRQAWWTSLLFVALGTVASTYLLGRTLAVISPGAAQTADLCRVVFGAGCDHALSDERFWFLAIPPAGWGVVYFVSLAALLFLARFLAAAFEAAALLTASMLSLAGLAAGLALTAVAIAAGAPICPLCIVVHAISLLLCLTVRGANARPFAEQLGQLRSAATWLLRSSSGTTERTRWSLVGLGAVALLAIATYQWVLIEAVARRSPAPRALDKAAILAAYRAAPEVELPVSEADPHLGPLTAPVRLVVFASFRCPSCRRFADAVSRLRHRFHDRLVVVYKHYPLSSGCNERLTSDMQPGACEAAWAAEAANRQARFWPFHDALYAEGMDASPETIAGVVRRLRLDAARFATDRGSESIRARVAEDIALGNQLKIPGTPTVFLDGRMVAVASVEILSILIQQELGREERESATGAQHPERKPAGKRLALENG